MAAAPAALPPMPSMDWGFSMPPPMPTGDAPAFEHFYTAYGADAPAAGLETVDALGAVLGPALGPLGTDAGAMPSGAMPNGPPLGSMPP